MEVREDKDVGFAWNGALQLLGLRHEGVEGGVHLKLAVDFHGDLEFLGFLAGEFGGGFHFNDAFIFTGNAFAGIAEEGDAGFLVGKVVSEGGGIDCDIADLSAVGIGYNGAVREEEDAVLAGLGFLQVKNIEGGNAIGLFLPLYDLQEGTQGAGSGDRRAGQHRIGLSGGEHQGGEVIIIVEVGFGFLLGEALEAAQTLELAYKALVFAAAARFNDTDVLEVDIEGRGIFLNFSAVAQQDRNAQLLRGKHPGSLKDALIGTFGKNNALGMAFQSLG